MRTALILAFRGADGDLRRDQPYPRDEADRRGARVFAGGDLRGAASLAAPSVAVDRDQALMALSFYAFLTMLSWYPVSFVVPATSLAYVAGAFGAKFLLQGAPERNALGRRGFHLFGRGIGVGGPDAGVAASAWKRFGFSRLFIFAAALVPLAFYLFSAWAAWRSSAAARHRAADTPRDSRRQSVF